MQMRAECLKNLSDAVGQSNEKIYSGEVELSTIDLWMIDGYDLLFRTGCGQPPQPPLLVLISFLPARSFTLLALADSGLQSIVTCIGELLISERHGARLQAWPFGNLLQEAARVEEAIFFESFAEDSQVRWVKCAPYLDISVEHVKGLGNITLRAMAIGAPPQLTVLPDLPEKPITCQLPYVLQPREISWLVCSENTCGSGCTARLGCVIFEEHPELEAIRMYFKSGHLWWEVAGLEPIPLLFGYETDRWHRITCHLDWNSKSIDVQIEPLPPGSAAKLFPGLPFHSAACDGIGSIALGSVVCARSFPKGCSVHISDISLLLGGRVGLPHASCQHCDHIARCVKKGLFDIDISIV